MDSENLKNAIDQLDLRLVNDILNNCGNVNGLVINDHNSQATPLLYAINMELRDKTDRDKMNEIILRLISAGVDVNAKGSWSISPLVLALNLHRNEEIVCQLISAGSNVNEHLSNDDSPLMIALRNEYSKTVIDSFIHTGANVNYSNRGQRTVLHNALCADSTLFMGSKPEIYMTLIQAGANVHARDSSGRNLFFHVLCRDCTDRNCKYQKIINVFLNHGVNIKEIDENGNNIIHLSNCLYLIRVAVNNGVSVDSVNNEGFTPLMLAIVDDDIKKLKKLLLLNANPNHIPSNFKQVDNFFSSGIDFDKILSLLIYHGADLYSPDYRTKVNEWGCQTTIIKHLLLFFDENAFNDFFCYENFENKRMINFVAENCKAELNKMRSSFLKGSLSLYKFCNLKRNYKSKYFHIPYGKYEYNCDEIKELFPIYEYLINMRIMDYKVERFKKVGRKCLEGVIVRSVSSEHETNSDEVLNYDCLNCIASYLGDRDVYHLYRASIDDEIICSKTIYLR